MQAQYARIPFADTSAYKIPAGLTDEQVLFLADILPTATKSGFSRASVKPGDAVAIVGAGPIGLAAVLTAKLYTPAHHRRPRRRRRRLDRALRSSARTDDQQRHRRRRCNVLELTDGLGADVAIEAVGVPATFELCSES